MPYLVRAINRENWPEPEEHIQVCELDADALNDLKTTDNCLSTWYAENRSDVDDAILAYLGSMDKWIKIEMHEFIVIDITMIKMNNIIIIPTPNETYIKNHAGLHRDLASLKFLNISDLCAIFLQLLYCNELVVKTGQQVWDLFKDAVRRNLISSEIISKERHGSLKKYIKKIEAEIDSDNNYIERHK